MSPIFRLLFLNSSIEIHCSKWGICAYKAQKCPAGVWNDGCFAVFWHRECKIEISLYFPRCILRLTDNFIPPSGQCLMTFQKKKKMPHVQLTSIHHQCPRKPVCPQIWVTSVPSLYILLLPPHQSLGKYFAACLGCKYGLWDTAQPRHDGLTGELPFSSPYTWASRQVLWLGSRRKAVSWKDGSNFSWPFL